MKASLRLPGMGIPFIMGLARARDVLVKPSTPTRMVVRFGLVASAFGVGTTWPNAAQAQVIEPPPHRIDFTVSPALPKCNDYDSFYGILVNWVRVRSILPTANRRLAVDIQRQPDGQKVVKLRLIDAEGTEIAKESHKYGATEECFKVLYWTAWDSTRLLQSTVPPPHDDPPMSVDKLVEEVEKSTGVPVKPRLSSETWPVCVREPEPPPPVKPLDTPKPERRLVLGVGAVAGLTRTMMPGFRVGIERSAGPLLIDLDAHLFPPLVSANDGSGPGHEVSAKGQAYLGSLALCAQKWPLLGCAVASGGYAGYEYNKPSLDHERFATAVHGGVFYVGVRTGFSISLSERWRLRLDVDAQLPVYRANVLQAHTHGTGTTPMLTGFVSIVPSF